MRWKIKGEKQKINKYVLIGVPHTSNWDFLFIILLSIHFRIKINWLGKKELFKFPFGMFSKFLGGIEVGNNTVDRMVSEFNKKDKFILGIAPSGDRKKKEWKTGFYNIAKLSNVPVVCGFIDYKSKTFGIKDTIYLTDNYEKDIERIKNNYK